MNFNHLSAEDQKLVGEYADSLYRLGRAEAEVVYTDEDGTIWDRPTAWAYAKACKALQDHKQRLRDAEAEREHMTAMHRTVSAVEPLTCQQSDELQAHFKSTRRELHKGGVTFMPEDEGQVDIVFRKEGPDLVFVEVENEERKSIMFGEWVQRDDGYMALRIHGKGRETDKAGYTAGPASTGGMDPRNDATVEFNSLPEAVQSYQRLQDDAARYRGIRAAAVKDDREFLRRSEEYAGKHFKVRHTPTEAEFDALTDYALQTGAPK